MSVYLTVRGDHYAIAEVVIKLGKCLHNYESAFLVNKGQAHDLKNNLDWLNHFYCYQNDGLAKCGEDWVLTIVSSHNYMSETLIELGALANSKAAFLLNKLGQTWDLKPDVNECLSHLKEEDELSSTVTDLTEFYSSRTTYELQSGGNSHSAYVDASSDGPFLTENSDVRESDVSSLHGRAEEVEGSLNSKGGSIKKRKKRRLAEKFIRIIKACGSKLMKEMSCWNINSKNINNVNKY